MEYFDVDFTYYQEVEEVTRTATLDHFFWNETFSSLVTDAGVLHSVDNFSDHCPIFCSFTTKVSKTAKPITQKSNPKPKWKFASDEDKEYFKEALNEKLSQLYIPPSLICCRDVHCKVESHRSDADTLLISALEALEASSYQSLPLSATHAPQSVHRRKTIPGWSENIEPYRKNADFWKSVWISAGKPLNCELHSIMKRTKNVYHFNVRKIKKSEDKMKKLKLIDACLNGNADLFKEIKKMRKHNTLVATSVDGIEGNISDHFKGIYNDLYNSVDDKAEMENLCAEVNEGIKFTELYEVNKVTPNVIKNAVASLSNGKSDPVFAYSSDCFIHGTEYLFEILAVVFQSFLIHGHMTMFLLLATLIPIIKDKLGSLNSSKNYRSIAISSLILKIFDWIIIKLYGSALSLDELQFAYQPGCSTTMCTWSVVETIDYFRRNGSDVYACCMDMSKAFDLVRHSILFKKLIKAGIPLIFVRLLLFIYMLQFANVKWQDSFSSIFSLSNGVRQGGVLSAILYCFYSNILFSNLRRSGYGCWTNGRYTGIYGYSDDNLLLAPSIFALQKMLDICEKFAADHGLVFSTDIDPLKSKTKCTAFTRKPIPEQHLKLCGNQLPWVDRFMHLGNCISNESCLTEHDIITKRARFITKCVELDQEIHFASGRTKLELNSIYNFHFTGSPIWNLFCKSAVALESTYNRSVKSMFNLPIETHRNLIESVTRRNHLRIVLMSRFANFLKQVSNSQKMVPKMLLSTIKNDARSVTGSNIRKILLLSGKLNIGEVTKRDMFSIKYHPLSREDKWKDSILNELIDARDGILNVGEFDLEEIESMIVYLCIS